MSKGISQDSASNPREHTEAIRSSSEPVEAPGRPAFSLENRPCSDTCQGKTLQLSWGSRSDVGLVRSHNEDSFLVSPPLFCVSDGMGGHEAGEVASQLAVQAIAQAAPVQTDDVALGHAIESANRAVIEAALSGVGKPGMGCTATAALVSMNLLAIAHVGDSRCYLLHAGKLTRLTRDHSFVEELIDAGEITADQARTHPNRSMVTRALGSDYNMYADHFLIEVSQGDRIILCTDGLNSMVPDAVIESLAVSSATPQQAADNLVSEALLQGGADNVSVIVVDVINDTNKQTLFAQTKKSVFSWIGGIFVLIALIFTSVLYLINTSWFLGISNNQIGIYQGINSTFLGFPLSRLYKTSSISLQDLPEALQKQLLEGLDVDSLEKAEVALESYQNQINLDKEKAQKVSENARNTSESSTTSGGN